MIFISTDKAANPISIYIKKVAEKICENFNENIKNKKIKIVRFEMYLVVRVQQ